MCPKLDKSPYEWEMKLAAITQESELAALQDEAKEEIGSEYAVNWDNHAKINNLKKGSAEAGKQRTAAWQKMQSIMEQARENLEQGKAVLSDIDMGTPIAGPPAEAPKQSPAPPAPPPPPGIGGEGAPPPPPPPGAVKEESGEQKAKRLAAQKRAEEIKAAKDKAHKVSKDKLDDELKKAEEAFKKAEGKHKAYVNGKPAFEGSTKTREQAYRDREGIVSDLNTNIREQKEAVEQLIGDLAVMKEDKELQKLPDYQQLIEAYGTLVVEEGKILEDYTRDAKKTVDALNSFVATYVEEEAKLKQQMDVQKAYRDELVAQKKETKTEKKAADNKNLLKNAFADRRMANKMGDMSNYSEAEIVKIRRYFYNKGANTPKDNALKWPRTELGNRLKGLIELQKISYEELKAVVGRPLFKDESNPTEVAVRGAEPRVTAEKDTTKLALAPTDTPAKPGTSAGMGGQSVSDSGRGGAIIPHYQAPTAPLSHDEMGKRIKGFKDALSELNVEKLYQRAGSKKSFVSAYLKKQHGDRPKQIQLLQKEVMNMANSLVQLRGELPHLDSKQQSERLQEIINKLDNAMDSVLRQMDKSGHRFKGTSRMENVISDLKGELNHMRVGIGLEAVKPKEMKK